MTEEHGGRTATAAGQHERAADRTTRLRIRTVAKKADRIGARPILILQEFVHHALTRRRRRRLRTRYSVVVAAQTAIPELRLPPLALSAADELPHPLAGAAARIRREAEQILEHRVDLLGSGLFSLGTVIDWHSDFKSNYRWEPTFYQDLEVTRLDDTSDAKVPWELSRGHHLLTLARAARLFREERFALELERQLASWLDANPAGHGINWTNPMEIAIRAVNWIWAIRTLEGWRRLEPSVRSAVTASLQVHGRHIAENLEGTPSLRSNHYLANVLGLLVIGAVLDRDPAADRFVRSARRAMEREILRQVHDDGVGFEAALPYHALALEMLLVARVAIGWTGSSFSAKFDDRLTKMLAASCALQHPGGRWPQIGDGDSGRILPAGFARPATVDHLLWTGAEILGTRRPLSGPPHEEVAWTLGLEAWHHADQLIPGNDGGAAAFPKGGFFVLRAGHTHVVARCGDVGQNGNGGHAHNDLLSFELSCGDPLVVDSGTYLYTADPKARNVFRSTGAHNTVVVSGEEINPLPVAELFTLRQAARPKVEEWDVGPGRVRLVVSHDGYRRLKPAAIHRRTFTLDNSTDALAVVDELLGQGLQHAESLIHLAPSVGANRTGNDQFRLELADGAVSVAFFGFERVEQTEGWVSDSYGTRSRAPLLIGHVSGELPLRFGYRFEPVSGPRPAEPAVRERSHA
jgi:hypothetical protein